MKKLHPTLKLTAMGALCSSRVHRLNIAFVNEHGGHVIPELLIDRKVICWIGKLITA